MHPSRKDAATGVLLGTLVGDVLGLPAEGMSSHAIQRRFGRIRTPRLLFGWGFVSDDTEQAALVAHSLLGRPTEDQVVQRFRRLLLGWFLRLPFGIGFGTLRACVKIAFGLEHSGVHSAGNGAAMRTAIIGAVLANDHETRRVVSRAVAEVTHLDPRAVEAAVLVSEVAAGCTTAAPHVDRVELVRSAMSFVNDAELHDAVLRACALAEEQATTLEAAAVLGTTGFVVHSVPFALFCFMRFAEHEMVDAIEQTIAAGGDTDTNGAIVGALIGAHLGCSSIPESLLGRVHDGPFGPSHLRALGRALHAGHPPPTWSSFAALVRNVALYPVILAHGFRRLLR